jgi:YD repeat-containing protein
VARSTHPGSCASPSASDLTAGDADDPRTLQRYDALGRVTSRTDEVGRVTRHEYAVTGQLVTVVDAAGGRTELTYDQRGTRGASVAVAVTPAEHHAFANEWRRPVAHGAIPSPARVWEAALHVYADRLPVLAARGL